MATKAKKFAEGTDISVERSLVEIKTLLKKYGATGIKTTESETESIIGFEMNGRVIRFQIHFPDVNDFAKGANGVRRNLAQAEQTRSKEIKRLYRALLASIKAKFIVVESGIYSFEQEFLGQTVEPATGQTVAEWAMPHLADGYRNGTKPPIMLPAPTKHS